MNKINKYKTFPRRPPQLRTTDAARQARDQRWTAVGCLPPDDPLHDGRHLLLHRPRLLVLHCPAVICYGEFQWFFTGVVCLVLFFADVKLLKNIREKFPFFTN